MTMFHVKRTPTKVFYSQIGLPEPYAWRFIVFATFFLGAFLLPSYFFNYKPILQLAIYPNFLNTLMGVLFTLGSLSILRSWYSSSLTQSERILGELRGHIFISGGFLAVALFSAPTFDENSFVFFISLGLSLGSFSRARLLGSNHFKFMRAVDDRWNF